MPRLRIWIILLLIENYSVRSSRGDIEYVKFAPWSSFARTGEDPMPERWRRLHLVKCTNERTGEEDRPQYNTRVNPSKKRMASFIYELPRKTKRMNELEQEANVNKPKNDEKEDEDVVVQLDSCNSTTTKQRAIEDSDDEDENILISENERGQIGPSDIENIMPSVVKHLEAITSCGLRDCDDSDHKRHHDFIRNPSEVKRQEADKSCFGTDEFSLKTVKYIGNKLLERFNYVSRNQRNPYKDPLPTQKIRGVDDDRPRNDFLQAQIFSL